MLNLSLILVLTAVILATELVALLTPLVVFAATEIVKRIFPVVQGWIIVMLVVPLLSLGVAWLTTLVATPDLAFWFQVLYGFLAVFVNELYVQLKAKFQSK